MVGGGETAALSGSDAMAGTGVAVVGCGAWGRNLARNFAGLGALCALVDPHAAVVEKLAETHGGRAASFEDVLADRRIDAVAIATQPSRHAALALSALHAGKHVLVEKPIALLANETVPEQRRHPPHVGTQRSIALLPAHPPRFAQRGRPRAVRLG